MQWHSVSKIFATRQPSATPWKSGDGSAPGGTPRRGCPSWRFTTVRALTPCRWSPKATSPTMRKSKP